MFFKKLDWIFGRDAVVSRDKLVAKDRDKPLLFTMARLDPVKNVVGFLEWYAHSDELRKRCNVLIAGGYVRPLKRRVRTESN